MTILVDQALVEQARRNASYWRKEIADGRVAMTTDFARLLRDLETAGGEPAGPPEHRCVLCGQEPAWIGFQMTQVHTNIGKMCATEIAARVQKLVMERVMHA